MEAKLYRSIKDNREGQYGQSYLVFNIAGHRVVVKPDDYDTSSLPTWEAWVSGEKKTTWLSVRGSAFNSVDERGYIYQEPGLVAEYIAIKQGWL